MGYLMGPNSHINLHSWSHVLTQYFFHFTNSLSSFIRLVGDAYSNVLAMFSLQYVVVGDENVLANTLIIWAHKKNAVFLHEPAYHLMGIMRSHLNNGAFTTAFTVYSSNTSQGLVTINHRPHLTVIEK